VLAGARGLQLGLIHIRYIPIKGVRHFGRSIWLLGARRLNFFFMRSGLLTKKSRPLFSLFLNELYARM
jgi:hypothetical protein